MCGRYTLATHINRLEERFTFDANNLPFTPSYNIAPTQRVLTIVGNGRNVPQYMRWGLIPYWAKDISIGARLINARSETLTEKPSFRAAFKKRRCLILADGFYEWRTKGPTKQPIHVMLKNGTPFAFAGLWETWTNLNGRCVSSCTIITTTSNTLVAPIHNRMPVILSQEEESIWLNGTIQDTSLLSELLDAYSEDEMDAYPVSSSVNTSRNNSPKLINRIV